jgi:hypothetical protein
MAFAISETISFESLKLCIVDIMTYLQKYVFFSVASKTSMTGEGNSWVAMQGQCSG